MKLIALVPFGLLIVALALGFMQFIPMSEAIVSATGLGLLVVLCVVCLPSSSKPTPPTLEDGFRTENPREWTNLEDEATEQRLR
jgi:hypothetical protein